MTREHQTYLNCLSKLCFGVWHSVQIKQVNRKNREHHSLVCSQRTTQIICIWISLYWSSLSQNPDNQEKRLQHCSHHVSITLPFVIKYVRALEEINRLIPTVSNTTHHCDHIHIIYFYHHHVLSCLVLSCLVQSFWGSFLM